MARLIFISPYMKGGRDAARLAHRTRYFATREGVQLLKDDNAHLPVTKKQQQYIQRLLRSFPEARELPEHEDYEQTLSEAADQAGVRGGSKGRNADCRNRDYLHGQEDR